MGMYYEAVPDSLMEWILKQKMFWVTTAPLSSSGHINVSPKGGEYFGLLDNKTFWYMELTGSGSETLAHLYEPRNGRITVMFNSFEGPPRILRLWGKGRVYESGTGEFDSFISKHDVKTIPGTRSIIVVDVHQVGSSCGFSVPYYEFKGHRQVLNDHFRKKEERYKAGSAKDRLDRYWATTNAYSMDGLPAMRAALKTGKLENVEPAKKMVGPLAPKNIVGRYGGNSFALETVWVVSAVSFILGVLLALCGQGLLDLSPSKVILTPFRADSLSLGFRQAWEEYSQ